MQSKTWILIGVLASSLVATSASAVDRKAGPIFSQFQAKRRCPKVCKRGERWNGQWRTTKRHKMSVCGCDPIAPPPAPPAPVVAPPTVRVQPPPDETVAPGPAVPAPHVELRVKRIRKAKHAARLCTAACTSAGHAGFTGHWWSGPSKKHSTCQCVAVAKPVVRVRTHPPAPAPRPAPAPVVPGTEKFVREAGPLWKQPDADKTCPGVCAAAEAKWNGQWWTTQPGKMSVCECVRPVVAPAPMPAPMPAPAPVPGPVGHDGCQAPAQACVCSNTARPGRCGTGPHKPGLYCRCD